MDNKKTLFVLGPNGRRHVIKVDPNSTLLQVLQDVCAKQGLKVDDYDIKHHNKCLDTSTIIRFSGLPNNAQLELTDAVKSRLESTIILGIQLEDGSRLVGSFVPDNTVYDVLVQLCPEEANLNTNPIIIYMRRNIYGRTALEGTNLRSLGITGGRAMLRLIHRSPEELGTQANISGPLPSKPVEEKPYIRKLQKCDSPPERLVPKQDLTVSQSVEHTIKHQSDSCTIGKKSDLITKIKDEKRKHAESPTKTAPKELVLDERLDYIEENTVENVDFVFLGSRNAMIFSQETAQAVPTEELPNDFFELTINDAKKLLRDIKRRKLELENAPLQTSTLRNLQQSNKEICLLNKYKMSIIRINFPDHTVLQGTFNPTDTINSVMEFVREYSEHPNTAFYLYTAPPKQILEVDKRLMEAGCVPNAILYYGTNEIKKDAVYLRKDLTDKFTTPSLASLAAAKMRKENTRTTSNALLNDDDVSFEDDYDINVGASTSTAPDTHYEDYPSNLSRASEPQKLPKWFKPV